ncbi:MAG: hypothetical protein ACPL07_00635 [Candidatus Bathyarchaeia archaeon]
MKKKLLISLTFLVWLCFFNFASIPLGFAKTDYKETMEAMVFFSAHPGELRLVKNIHLIFENMSTGPPINSSITALNDGFLELKCSLETKAVNGLFVKFDVYFEPSIDNEIANLYTDNITSEIVEAFNYSGLNLSWKDQGIREGKMWVYRSFRIIPITKENVLTFLKFAPKNGFSRFIEGLVDKYFPGDSTTGLSPEYWLKKRDSDFRWDLVITGMSSDLLPWDVHKYSYSISLKELLNTTSPIVEELSENQQIIILYEKNHTELLSRGITTYTIDIDNIQPSGYIVGPSDWPNWTEIRYEPLFPMEDIVVRMNLNSFTQSDSRGQLIRLAIAAIIILVALLMVILWMAKKRKGGERVVEREGI